jgi:hypothetical protein
MLNFMPVAMALAVVNSFSRQQVKPGPYSPGIVIYDVDNGTGKFPACETVIMMPDPQFYHSFCFSVRIPPAVAHCNNIFCSAT